MVVGWVRVGVGVVRGFSPQGAVLSPRLFFLSSPPPPSLSIGYPRLFISTRPCNLFLHSLRIKDVLAPFVSVILHPLPRSSPFAPPPPTPPPPLRPPPRPPPPPRLLPPASWAWLCLTVQLTDVDLSERLCSNGLCFLSYRIIRSRLLVPSRLYPLCHRGQLPKETDLVLKSASAEILWRLMERTGTETHTNKYSWFS